MLNPMPLRKLIQSRQRARGEGDITLLRREDSLLNFTWLILQLNNCSQSKTRGWEGETHRKTRSNNISTEKLAIKGWYKCLKRHTKMIIWRNKRKFKKWWGSKKKNSLSILKIKELKMIFLLSWKRNLINLWGKNLNKKTFHI